MSAQTTISGEEDERSFSDKVKAIIREYLTAHAGATKDRIYDEVVSRMVRAGQMEAHNFEELLEQVAEPVREPVMRNLFEQREPDLFDAHEIVRWYLKEAEKLGAFIAGKLEQNPAAEGVHYSDLFEQYVHTVKDKPRRPLAEWLLDYFFKTDSGTCGFPRRTRSGN